MKKVVVLFVLMIMALGVALATDSDTLIITLSITAVPPEFQMIGSFTEGTFDSANTATQDGKGMTYTGNPDQTDVVLYVQVNQSNNAKYSNTFNLTVTATDFGGVAAEAAIESTTTVSNRTINSSAANNVATFAMTYNGNSVASSNVGVVSFSWATVAANLPVGTYTSTITLGYAAP